MKVVDDVFVFADVKGDKFFVGDGFGFDVFGSVGILQCVDGFFELTAWGTYINDHDSFTVSAQRIFEEPGKFWVLK